MTVSTQALRKKLTDRLGQVIAKRQQQELLKKSGGSGCDHEWRTYRQAITIDWDVRVANNKTRDYCGPSAPYFVVKACPKCKTKRYIDMRSD